MTKWIQFRLVIKHKPSTPQQNIMNSGCDRSGASRPAKVGFERPKAVYPIRFRTRRETIKQRQRLQPAWSRNSV